MKRLFWQKKWCVQKTRGMPFSGAAVLGVTGGKRSFKGSRRAEEVGES